MTFATIDLAVTLGYTLKAFLKMNLRQLIPAPTNLTHEKWLRDAPPSHPLTRCAWPTIDRGNNERVRCVWQDICTLTTCEQAPGHHWGSAADEALPYMQPLCRRSQLGELQTPTLPTTRVGLSSEQGIRPSRLPWS